MLKIRLWSRWLIVETILPDAGRHRRSHARSHCRDKVIARHQLAPHAARMPRVHLAVDQVQPMPVQIRRARCIRAILRRLARARTWIHHRPSAPIRHRHTSRHQLAILPGFHRMSVAGAKQPQISLDPCLRQSRCHADTIAWAAQARITASKSRSNLTPLDSAGLRNTWQTGAARARACSAPCVARATTTKSGRQAIPGKIPRR